VTGSGRGLAPSRALLWGRIVGGAADPARGRYRRSPTVYPASAHAISGRGATTGRVAGMVGGVL
jgi:hypothetical protein